MSYCGKYRTLNIFDCIRFQASNKMNPIQIQIKLILKWEKFIIIAIEKMKNSNKLFQYLYFNRVSNVQFLLFFIWFFLWSKRISIIHFPLHFVFIKLPITKEQLIIWFKYFNIYFNTYFTKHYFGWKVFISKMSLWMNERATN